ncbi:MAG: hypothetical protein KF847_04855 [Pirellulales bacterium]|nr:hypothetical protein [Pirellulales bacterium]
MNFGMYLVREGRLTSDEFFALLELQIASRPQLGTLAIETGRLSVRQVFQVLRCQCESTSRMFGEVAVELGFLTEEDVAVLVYQQSQRSASLPELLVLHGYAEPGLVEQWLDDYRSYQGRAAAASGGLTAYEAASAAVC